jgi:hypothetical protein
MPSLYERILEVHPTRPKIPVDTLFSVIGERQRGQVTVDQADAVIATESGGFGLDTVERQEVADLLATIPGGNTTAARLDRNDRIREIRDVFLLCDQRHPPHYDTPANVRARLGVPTR